MEMNPNLHTFFASGFYADYWKDELTLEISKSEANDIIKLLGAQKGRVLDWRGGWGRHSIHFAELGMDVIILDIVKSFLDLAQERFSEKNLNVSTLHMDSLLLPENLNIDFVLCCTNALGYLSLDEEIRALKRVRNTMSPGAKIIVDCMNLLTFSKSFLKEPLYVNDAHDDKCIRRQYNNFNFQTNTLHNVFEFEKPDGTIEIEEFKQVQFTPKDLIHFLKEAGFKVTNCFSDYKGTDLSFDSERIVAIAEK